jgi:hypothetical protein
MPLLLLVVERSPAKRDPDARFHGLTRFSVYQGRWSCSSRDFERDILPMCQSEGLALAPWGVLGRGQFKTPEEFQHEGTRNMGLQDDKNRVMHEKLAEVGRRKRTAPTNISLAYVLHKAPYVFPVIGCRTVEHFESSIQSLEVELTDDEVCEIEDAVPFDLGFPMSFLFETPRQKYRSSMSARHIWQVTCNTRLETVPGPRVSNAIASLPAESFADGDIAAHRVQTRVQPARSELSHARLDEIEPSVHSPSEVCR